MAPRAAGKPAAIYFQPTGRRTYLLLDEGGQLMGARGNTIARIGGAESARKGAEWGVRTSGRRAVTLSHTADGRTLSLARRGRALVLRPGRASGSRARFRLSAARGCTRFPEADVGASGRPFTGTTRGGLVRGFVDTHLHITADMRAGGRVLHGKAFDRFGITRSLGGDALDHGPDGSLDVTGNLLRDGIPFGTHSVDGWPSFAGWPTFDTNTHQQTYWVWLQRAWKAGLRLVVAQTVEDDQLCLVIPVRSHSCDETATIALEVKRLRGLQDYVDAQSGGPGRGWFRLVYGPREARRVIERGKLAVVIGVESSNPFGCGLRDGGSQCTRADVDRGIKRFRRLGVRSLFIAHWLDNAFAGAALEGGVKGKLINGMNALRTGSYFATGACPESGQGEQAAAPSEIELTVIAPFYPAVRPLLTKPAPDYPEGLQCNVRGLTALGSYLVRRLMANHMLIEADHLSEKARASLLAMAEAKRYPLISSHNGTGGSWTPSELRRLYALGGLASATPGQAPELIDKVLRQREFRSPAGTSEWGWAPTPAGSRPCPARLRAPIRCATRSSRTTAGSSSAASARALEPSISTATAWRTTACSPTCSRTCSAGTMAVRRWPLCSARRRPTCRCGAGRASRARAPPAAPSSQSRGR